MSTIALPKPDVGEQASQAVEALLRGYGLRGAATLPILRQVAEKVEVTEESEAFNRVRLRSVGVEEEILAEEGGALSDADFAKRLRLKSRQTVHNYRDSDKIFAITRGARNYVYPALQIHEGALLPGLTEVLRTLRAAKHSPMGILLFFLTPAEALDDKRPLDLLRRGEIDEAVLHAERYGVIGS